MKAPWPSAYQKVLQPKGNHEATLFWPCTQWAPSSRATLKWVIHSNLDNANDRILDPHNNYPGSPLQYSITGCLHSISGYILNITVEMTCDFTV